MHLFPVLIFLSVLNISAGEPCDSNIIEQDESFYRNLSKPSSDISVIKKYIEVQGQCFNKGVHLIEKRGVPILESFVCDNSLKSDVAEHFFLEGDLCFRKVAFFPSRNVFYIDEVITVNSIANGWDTITSKNSTLFYKKSAPFKENQNVRGRVLNISEEGLVTSDIQKPVFPYFLFRNESWESVLPLRELFHLSVNTDKSFNISIITEAPLSFEKEELLDIIGLKAEAFQIETPLPYRYLISGKNISGVRIPKLRMSKTGNSFHGRYIIRLSHPGITDEEPKSFEEDSFQITVENENNTMTIELTVFFKDLKKIEVEKIMAAINREIPPFHIIKENDK